LRWGAVPPEPEKSKAFARLWAELVGQFLVVLMKPREALFSGLGGTLPITHIFGNRLILRV